MAYYLWGGSPADATFNVSGTLAGGVALEAWNAGSGGTRLTDLKLFTGSYTTEGAAAASGYFPSFSDAFVAIWAPDTVTAVFVTGQGSSGRRYALHRIDIDAIVAGILAAAYIPGSQKGAAGGVVAFPTGTTVIDPANLPASSVAGVSSVNGDTGAVTVDADSLGLDPLSLSGEWVDVKNRPTVPTTAQEINAIPSSELGATGGVPEFPPGTTVLAPANVPIGVTGGAASFGHTHTGDLVTLLPGGLFIRLYNSTTGAYPVRGTTRTDIHAVWVGPTPPSGGSYALTGIDFNWRTPVTP